MNSKNIKKHLNAKLKDWLSTIDDESIKCTILRNAIITGGALVSLLTGEPVNDYDVYLKTKEACIAVAEYYVNRWNKTHSDNTAELKVDDTGKISVFIPSKGVVSEDGYNVENESPDIGDTDMSSDKESIKESKPRYRPVYMTSNAITLSNKVQIVIRFYGDVNEIHKNYDFAHCTCAWSAWSNELFLPEKALECIINKELFYVGSKYPLCSIIRTRKYLERGYHIDAGQYLKMAIQLNQLDLNNIDVLKDQLVGVDSAYFSLLIEALKPKTDESGKLNIDSSYVIEVVNRLF